MDAAQIRAILIEHSEGADLHQGFHTMDGTYYEGYYEVDEKLDVIHFVAGGPMGGWERTFAFAEINLDTLI